VLLPEAAAMFMAISDAGGMSMSDIVVPVSQPPARLGRRWYGHKRYHSNNQQKTECLFHLFFPFDCLAGESFCYLGASF
jgi:hypothetical protein